MTAHNDKNIVVLHNPTPHLRRALLFKRLQARLPEQARFFESTGDYDADLKALKETCQDADLLVAVGGDGTLNLAVNAIAETRTILGVVPAGSGNDFARIWVTGLKADDIIDAALNGSVISIDLGQLNDRYFLNIAGIGFDAHMVHHIKHKTWPRAPRYILHALALLPFYRARTIETAEASAKVNSGKQPRSFMLSIGNGRYFGSGMPITPHARLNDGVLAYCHIKERFRLATAWCLLRMLFRRHLNAGQVQSGQLESLEVSTTGIPMQVDGEYIGTTPASIRVRPGALRIHKL
ncbi:diacylglycerol/lipid kinase family protein [Aliidiomarina sp. Khilg15.8]